MSKEPRDIFVGVDFQEDRWHVTSRDVDDQLFSHSLDEGQPSPACPFYPTKMKR